MMTQIFPSGQLKLRDEFHRLVNEVDPAPVGPDRGTRAGFLASAGFRGDPVGPLLLELLDLPLELAQPAEDGCEIRRRPWS